MNRREFFHPYHLAGTAGSVLTTLDDLDLTETDTFGEVIPLLRVAGRAMATTFEILIPCGTPGGMDGAATGLDEIARLEDQLTVYRDHSEVSQLNRLAFLKPCEIEEQLFGLLQLAERLTQDTEGAFDITTGALIKAWGFFRRTHRIPLGHERAEVLTRVGMKHVILKPDLRTVQFLREGLEINLGSIGKGYALDRVAEMLRSRWKISAALLHGGHSSVYAIGSEPGHEKGWPVGLRHPWDCERRLAVIRLRDRALGTSAATFQHLEFAGRKLGHILDPRTGWPAETLASASAVATTAAQADALATAFFILGIDKTKAYCTAHPGVGAVLVPAEENAVPVAFGLGPADIVWNFPHK